MTQDHAIQNTARRRLRSLRLARGWSIDELATRSDISPSTISRLETGKRRLALDHLVTLARALDTTIDELLVDADSEDVITSRRTWLRHHAYRARSRRRLRGYQRPRHLGRG